MRNEAHQREHAPEDVAAHLTMREVILSIEDGETLVQCPDCEGCEGGIDENGEWHACSACDGEGGYWRQTKPEDKVA